MAHVGSAPTGIARDPSGVGHVREPAGHALVERPLIVGHSARF
jgi:hypothetical protein